MHGNGDEFGQPAHLIFRRGSKHRWEKPGGSWLFQHLGEFIYPACDSEKDELL